MNLSKKGIGASAAIALILIVLSAIGIGIAVWKGTTEQRTMVIRHRQAMALHGKLVFDHTTHLLNDSLWLSGEQAVWEEGRSNRLWNGKIPTRSEIKGNLNKTFNTAFKNYVEKVTTREDVELLIRSSVHNVEPSVKMGNFSLLIKISPKLVVSMENPPVKIWKNVSRKRNFSLRYGLLYEKARKFSKNVGEINFDDKEKCKIKNCGHFPGSCPSSQEVEQKCLSQYKSDMRSKINDEKPSLPPEFNLQYQIDLKYGKDINSCQDTGNICNEESIPSGSCPEDCKSYCRPGELYDEHECTTDGSCDIGTNITALGYASCDDGGSCCCKCKEKKYWQKRNGTLYGKWAIIKITLGDSESQILTPNGHRDLKFIRRYNTTI